MDAVELTVGSEIQKRGVPRNTLPNQLEFTINCLDLESNQYNTHLWFKRAVRVALMDTDHAIPVLAEEKISILCKQVETGVPPSHPPMLAPLPSSSVRTLSRNRYL